MLETILRRRSVRRFTDEKVSEEELRLVLEAAMAAPSAHGRRPWHLVVVTERASLEALAAGHPYGKMLARAPVAVAVCADTSVQPKQWVEDCSAAAQNILLAATALGLGAVWVGIHPYEDRRALVQQVLGVPDGIGVLCVIPIGRPAEQPRESPRFDPSRVHRERF